MFCTCAQSFLVLDAIFVCCCIIPDINRFSECHVSFRGCGYVFSRRQAAALVILSFMSLIFTAVLVFCTVALSYDTAFAFFFPMGVARFRRGGFFPTSRTQQLLPVALEAANTQYFTILSGCVS